jgi:hypothetical protein
MISTLL